MMDPKSLRLVALVFAVFLIISLAIYGYGRRKHADGGGLATEHSREYIVQVFVKNHGVTGVDARPKVPAFRLQENNSFDLVVILRNMEKRSARRGVLRGAFVPGNAGVLELSPQKSVVEIGPGAEQQVPVRITLGESAPETIDGTIDLKLDFLPASGH